MVGACVQRAMLDVLCPVWIFSGCPWFAAEVSSGLRTFHYTLTGNDFKSRLPSRLICRSSGAVFQCILKLYCCLTHQALKALMHLLKGCCIKVEGQRCQQHKEEWLSGLHHQWSRGMNSLPGLLRGTLASSFYFCLWLVTAAKSRVRLAFWKDKYGN